MRPNWQAVLFWCALLMGTAVVPMKRTADEIGSGGQTHNSLFILPHDVLQEYIYPFCDKSKLIRTCKLWFNMFNIGRIKSIIKKYPVMITHNPIDCCRVYYRLIKENEVETITTLIAADPQSQENIGWLLRKGCIVHPSTEIQKLLEACLLKKFGGYESKLSESTRELADIIFYNDTVRTQDYLQRTDRETLSKDVENNLDIIARYTTIAMLEALKSTLILPVAPDAILGESRGREKQEGKAFLQDIIVGKASLTVNGHRVDIVEYLLSKGASNNYDYNDESSLVGAVTLAHEKNDYTLLDVCAAYDFDVNYDDEGRFGAIYDAESSEVIPVLTWAVRRRNPLLVHQLLHLRADPDAKAEPDSKTLLEEAEERGNTEIIQAIRFAQKGKRIASQAQESVSTEEVAE